MSETTTANASKGSKMRERAKIYGLPGSTATWVGRLMLDHKGIDYKLIQLPTLYSRPMLRAMGFPHKTTPAIKLGGRKLQLTLSIAKELEKSHPEPSLYPGDADKRARVEDAERWAEDVLQSCARRVVFSPPVRKNARPDLASFFDGPLLGQPPKLAVAVSPVVLGRMAKLIGATAEVTKDDLAAVPGHIDHIDALIEEGTIGGEQLNVADYQIAPSVRALMSLDDLRPLIAMRPAGRHAERVAFKYHGRIRHVFPEEWLRPMRDSTRAQAVA